MGTILYAAFAIFLASALSTYFLIHYGIKFQLFDYPNNRSLHKTPVPRIGGVAICFWSIAGILLCWMWSGYDSKPIWIAISALIISVVSFFDDRSHVPVMVRIVIHVLASIIIIACGLDIQVLLLPDESYTLTSLLSWFLSLLYIVWMINLYNFMDGMDGFSGGMATAGFSTLGLLGYLGGDNHFASICWLIAAASAGFLVWNFPPARIFMGDVGSSALGFLAAALSLWANRIGLFPLWLAILVFTPFIFDATLTLVRRTLNGERIWEAHRNHYYQRLVQAGWSHRRTVLWEYGLMLLCCSSALVAYHATTLVQWSILAGVAWVCLVAVIGVHRVEKYAVSQASKISS